MGNTSSPKHMFYNEYLPKGWVIKTVDSLKSPEKYSCTAGPFGSNISSKFFVDEGVPVIRGGNLSIGKEKFIAKDFVFISEDKAREFPGQQVKSGDLVFTCWGTLGQVGLIPDTSPFDTYIISNKQLKLRPNSKQCNSKFLYYYFSLPQMVRHINDIAIGSAVPGINLGLLKSIKVCLPPKELQDKISATLSTYDDLIENNKQHIALLEKMAEEIYREWFVRFRFPGYQSVEFEKGIPKAWNSKSIREIVTYYIGGGWGEDNEGPTFTEKAYVIRGTDIPKLAIGDYSSKVLRFHKTSNFKSRKLEENDFVFEVSGGSKDQLLGRNLMVTKGLLELFNNRVICASFCKQIRFDPEKVSPFFMKYFLKLYYTCDLVGIYQVQSTGISNYQFESFLNYQTINLPCRYIQDKFENLVQPLIKQQEALALQNLKLEKTKTAILPRLISGKLSIEDLDIQFPPSMVEET
ncbi:restriction endonuclease subunit S [Neptuniibacter sp. QD57_21]|uniref:restriction endonuclease subunit S n=1 Tax=Neptuniibacter sp. QD57_21 TaxID=3398213 RepID=UPI0039F53C7A